MTQTTTSDALAVAAKEWRDIIEPLLDVGADQAEIWPEVLDNPRLRAEFFAYMYSQIATGFLTIAYGNDHHPDFFPGWGQVLGNIGNISPDGVYLLTPLDPAGTYRLRGQRNTTKIVDFQLGDGTVFAYGRMGNNDTYGPTLANYDIDHDATLDERGWFDVILSAERPEGHTGDWWELKPETNHMVIRQFASDWLNEIDARIAIDRLDTPAAKPHRDAPEILEQLARVGEFIWSHNKTLEIAAHADPGLASEHLLNNVVRIDFSSDQAGRQGHWYLAGRFDIDEDEALIITLKPGNSRFWNLHTCNEVLNTMDFMNRLVSVNDHQAEADDGGVYRIAVSAQDPGVPNWLDTTGHPKGWLWGRLDSCDNDEAPTVQKVKLAELRDHYPAGTREVTQDERDATIRDRRAGAQLRRRW